MTTETTRPTAVERFADAIAAEEERMGAYANAWEGVLWDVTDGDAERDAEREALDMLALPFLRVTVLTHGAFVEQHYCRAA